MKVAYKSKVLPIINKIKRDESYHAFKDLHDGITATKQAVESMKINHEVPRGPADGTNKLFRINNHPSLVVVNGAIQVEGLQYIFADGLIRFVTPPPLNAIIRAHYL